MNITSSSSPWICAWKAGDALNTASTSASITHHDNHNQFTLDLTKARGLSSPNPFLNTSSAANASTGSSTSSAGSINGPVNDYAKTHSVIMVLTVVLFFPMGALSIRLLNFPGLIWFHAAIQLLNLCLLFTGFGLGIHLGNLKTEVQSLPFSFQWRSAPTVFTWDKLLRVLFCPI